MTFNTVETEIYDYDMKIYTEPHAHVVSFPFYFFRLSIDVLYSDLLSKRLINTHFFSITLGNIK